MHVRERRRLQDALTAIRLNVPVAASRRAAVPQRRALSARACAPRAAVSAARCWRRARSSRAGCHFSLDELRYEYPRELVPPGETPRAICAADARRARAGAGREGVPASERAAIEHELALIAELSYEPYFLTVQDIVAYARSQGDPVPGTRLGGQLAGVLLPRASRRSTRSAARRCCSSASSRASATSRPTSTSTSSTSGARRSSSTSTASTAASARRSPPRSSCTGRAARCAISARCSASTPERVRPARQGHAVVGRERGSSPSACARPGSTRTARGCRRLLPLAARADRLPGFPRHLSQHVGGFVIARRPARKSWCRSRTRPCPIAPWCSGTRTI